MVLIRNNKYWTDNQINILKLFKKYRNKIISILKNNVLEWWKINKKLILFKILEKIKK